MSLESKAVFMSRLKSKIGTEFTVNDTERMLALTFDCLSGFSMETLEEIDNDKDDLLETYLNALEIGGRSKKTLRLYKYTIIRLLENVKVKTNEITVHHLRNYFVKEKERGISDTTLESNRQNYSAYFNWLQKEGLIRTNPIANLTAIKCKKKIKDIYSDIDIERLKQHCKTLRDRAIVCFLLSTACRISEMTGLNINDVDFNNLECTVLGKGNKERTVYLDSVSATLLSEYLASRKDNSEALFVSLKNDGKRFQPGGVRVMLNALGSRAHVKNVYPHKFRRTKATNMIRHGMPIQEVAAILGHEKIDTTMEYIVMDKTGIKNSYHKYA